MIFGPSLLLLKINFFASPISAEMTRSFKCHDYENFKNFITMLKNFLMIVDMTVVVALGFFICVIWSYSYYFQATSSFHFLVSSETNA